MYVSHIGQRVAVLFDVPNLYLACRFVFSGKLNYERCLNDIIKDRQLVRAIAFATRSDKADNTTFVSMLQAMGIEVVNKTMKSHPDSTGVVRNYGSINVDLAMCAMSLASRVDVVVLVTGNGDFVPLAHSLRHLGVRVEIVGVQNSIAAEFASAADQITQIVQGPWVFTEAKFQNAVAPETPAPAVSSLGSTVPGQVSLAGLPKDQ